MNIKVVVVVVVDIALLAFQKHSNISHRRSINGRSSNDSEDIANDFFKQACYPNMINIMNIKAYKILNS